MSWSIDIQQRAIAQLQDAALASAEQLRADGRYGDADEIAGVMTTPTIETELAFTALVQTGFQ